MGLSSKRERADHAMCIPLPFQGHIKPMLSLAQILHSKGFHITFVNTEYNHRRLLKSTRDGGGDSSLRPFFKFAAIPDGLPLTEDLDAPRDGLAIIENVVSNRLEPPLKELLSNINDEAASSSEMVPPVTCLIADVAMGFSLAVAEEFGLKASLLETVSACSFRAFLHCRWLIDNDFLPPKDSSYLTNGYLETVINSIPSMNGIRLKDFPTFIRTTNPDDMMLNVPMSNAHRALKAAPIIFNTFDCLDQEILGELSTLSPHIYPIGPLHLLAGRVEDCRSLNPIRSGLWREDPLCIQWLNSQEPGSVLYVNFGSSTVMSQHQLVEFAWGIANSGHRFLWIIRSGLVIGDHDQSNALPREFLAETTGRGLLASWCDQESVLGHSSIKGFMTHCGWNSTIETISSGVPMLCWPFFADQVTNCWYCCHKLGICIELSHDVRRDEVEKKVRELMEGAKGREMKWKAVELKILAKEAIMGPNGSSYVNLEKLIARIGANGASHTSNGADPSEFCSEACIGSE